MEHALLVAEAPISPAPCWTLLAHILRPQGRKGEVLADLMTDFPERFDAHPRIFLAPSGFAGLESEARVAGIASFWLPVGRNRGRIVLQLRGVDSIEAAEKLSGLDVIVPETERIPLEDDAKYVSDLVGCAVFDLATANPCLVGTVIDVQFATTPDGGRRLDEAAPLLVAETLAGEEILIPFVKAFLVTLDPEAKRIEMSLPAGLLDVNR